MDIKKTANLLLNFAINRLAEIFGVLVSLAGVLLFLALVTYSPSDPNFIFPENTKIENLMGYQGSFVSDLFFQSIGVTAYLIPFTLFFTGINIITSKEFFLFIENLFFAVLYSIFGTLFLTYFYSDAFTLYINGNGGFVGNYINHTFLNTLININENIFKSNKFSGNGYSFIFGTNIGIFEILGGYKYINYKIKEIKFNETKMNDKENSLSQTIIGVGIKY